MAIKMQKIVTSEGIFYVLLNTIIDQYISPAFSSWGNFVKYFTNFYSSLFRDRERLTLPDQPIDNMETLVLNRETIFTAISLLAKLKCGQALTDDEATALYKFERFLMFTVAFHQNYYSELNQAVVDKWIDELDLRKPFANYVNQKRLARVVSDLPNKLTAATLKAALDQTIGWQQKIERGEELSDTEKQQLGDMLKLIDSDSHGSLGQSEMAGDIPDWDWQDILDHAQDQAYYQQYFDNSFPQLKLGREPIADPEALRKLTGRHISRLVLIARVAGPNKRTPVEVIEYFRPKSESTVASLEKRLHKYKLTDRSRFLLGIYKQVVLSHKNKMAKGEYRQFYNADVERGLDLIVWLGLNLDRYGLKHHAKRLRKQYL